MLPLRLSKEVSNINRSRLAALLNLPTRSGRILFSVRWETIERQNYERGYYKRAYLLHLTWNLVSEAMPELTNPVE